MINSSKNIIASILMLLLLISLSGCANIGPKPGNESTKQAAAESVVSKEKAVMDEFNRMMQKSDITAGEINKYINENISSVSQLNASTMIIALEKNQQLSLPKMQDKFADDDTIQKTLAKDYRGDLTDRYIDGLQDKAIRELLVATKDNGFKIETAEGFYFPVIDYSFYKKYRSNITQDIAAYIDIMAIESDKTPVKDAGLMIGWEEILKRASSHERFIKEFSDSAKAEDVKQLLTKYMVFALYGTNNTPLFSYEDEQMVPAAKKTYLEFAFNENNGSFSKIMTEYLAVVKKNDYKLSKEVDDYRKKAVEAFR
jgi:predicted small lipoprotein YifL